MTCCRDLEKDIENDPEVREVLEGTGGDPKKVLANMARLRESYGEADDLNSSELGVATPMRVLFRGFDPQGLYVRVPSAIRRL